MKEKQENAVAAIIKITAGVVGRILVRVRSIVAKAHKRELENAPLKIN